MTDPFDRERKAAARSRALAAALADFPDEARKHLEDAEVGEEHIALCEALEESRARFNAARDDRDVAYADAVAAWAAGGRKGDKPALVSVDAELAASHKAAQQAVYEHRRYWRSLGALAGARTGVAVRNNVTED